MAENRNIAAANYVNNKLVNKINNDDTDINWGANAKRSLYHTTNNLSTGFMAERNLLNSRLWHGVPQLTDNQLSMFEAAYTGHTFIFVVDVPKFMSEGIYKDTNMHQHMKNLKSIMERASTGFSGFSPIMASQADQDDGAGRKVSHITSVTKTQSNISTRLHEFAGLPVKNAIETWLTGIYDYRSQHGNYHGNLGIKNGWCLANHSMKILVVQVTPDWTTIQDAAYYYNMVPLEVPFQHFNWTKGDHTIVDDYDIEFVANEERSPAIMYAAEKYMNNRVLSLVSTSVYNSRQFVASDFDNGALTKDWGNINQRLDEKQYNMYIKNSKVTKNKEEKNTVVRTNFGSNVLETELLDEDNTGNDPEQPEP